MPAAKWPPLHACREALPERDILQHPLQAPADAQQAGRRRLEGASRPQSLLQTLDPGVLFMPARCHLNPINTAMFMVCDTSMCHIIVRFCINYIMYHTLCTRTVHHVMGWEKP